MAKILLCTAVALLILRDGTAFLPSPHHHHGRGWRRPLCMTTAGNKETEALLREELMRQNEAAVADEGRYALRDLEGMEGISKEPSEANQKPTTTTPLPKSPSVLQARIDRATKPRAYPLFLAEKAATIAEEIVEGVMNLASNLGLSFGDLPEEELNGSPTPNKKERVVVLGTGWGSAAFLKGVDMDKYDVTVISPRNFFLFTPMLAGASVGTVEYRSITEPVREINKRAEYLEGIATAIDPKAQTVSCETVVCEGNSCELQDFAVEYDRLIFAVGAQTNTFNIPGVRDYCCFLKQVEDAQRIRTSLINCFERASLPQLTDEERQNILTFAIIGAGPTGIEFASELRDFVEQDGPKYYPKLLKHVRIKIIEASSTILAPFDKSLQAEAISQLKRKVNVKDPDVADLLPESFELTELLLDSGVSEVKEDVICLNNGKEIHYGLSVWAAGNGPLSITLDLIDVLGKNGEQAEAQSIARGRVAVDPWLRALGGEGKIFAMGDCVCITKGGGQQLPATGQVASQQGEFLARLFERGNLDSEKEEGILKPPVRNKDAPFSVVDLITSFAMNNGEFMEPFQFLNLGILAYVGGGSALAQVQVAPADSARVKSRGKAGFLAWRSIYLAKQVSLRNRLLVLIDWTKTLVFGRDITRF